jgi:ketosteroid isomerase-like protein
MKSIISFFAVITLSTAAVLAQEESPAASPEATTEEKASATVEETPAATVAPMATPEATVAPAMKAEKATPETRKATAAAPSKAASPAKTSTETETTAAAKPMKKMTGPMSVKDMENRWEAAVGTHDLATVEGYVAPDFVGVTSKGKFVGRSGLISEFKGDKDTYKSAKNEKLNIKNFGPNVTVVTGRAREKGTAKDGKAFDRTFLFTDTWVSRNGQWQCVASQVSQIK